MGKSIRLLVTALVLALQCQIYPLWAQDAAPAPAGEVAAAPAVPGGAAAAQEVDINPGAYTIIFGMGFVNLVIWIAIFLASFAMVALIIDGVLAVKREKLLPTSVVTGVREALDQGDLGGAVTVCEQNPGPLANILMAGFGNINEGYDVIQESVTAATDLESEKLMQRINYLNLCGQIAPMLGLLGTVTGMVSAFASLANAGPSKDKLLAVSISTALWTTVAGLLISVPALLAYTLFKNMAVRVLLESEATVLDLLKILRTAEVEEEAES